MTKRNLTLIVVVTFLLSGSLIAGTYSGGTGTSGDPYQIATTADLIELSNTSGDWGAYFIQTANISFDEDETQVDWNNSGSAGPTEGFSPIGNGTTNFTGSYNGADYTIDNLFINRPSASAIGLFGLTYGATIESLGVKNVDISGDESVGGLIGINYKGSIVSNSYCTGSVSGNYRRVGGLVGHNYDNSEISNSYSTCTVSSGTGNYVGGLVGFNYVNSTVSNSYSTGDVSGMHYIGGLVGENDEGTISYSYSTGDVNSSEFVSYVGGLVGANQNSATVSNSYSTGVVTGGSYQVGGLVGYQYNGGTVSNSFWDTETSGQSGSSGGTGKTTSQMQTESTFTDAGWDFTDTWVMSSSITFNEYPTLQWTGAYAEAPTSNQIASLPNLVWIAEDNSRWSDTYTQTAVINAWTTPSWDDGKGWTPIGNNSVNFTGSYNGQGYTISNLYINRSASNIESNYYIALFGYINGGSISNLGVINLDVTGYQYVGGLIGQSENSSTVTDCFTTGVVSEIKYYGGGFAGWINNSTVRRCYTQANITSNMYGGGFAGILYGATISNCYTTGKVTRCTGSTSDKEGGFAGYNNNSTTEFCYSTAKVIYEGETNPTDKGFVAFDAGGIYIDNFFDSDASEQSSGTGATALTTAQMKDYNTFFDAGWDFMDETNNGSNDNWGINSEENNGYPFLEWQGYQHNPPQARNLYISEVSDNQSGEGASTGFIELWNDTGSEVSLNGYSILQGTNNGSGFVAGSYSYSLPDGYSIPADGFFVIGNGADLSTFNSAWGLSLTTAQYDNGNSSLQLTNGHAYALDDGSRAIIDETEEVGTEERIYQASAGSWTIENPTTGTPGGFGDDTPLPVTLSSFTAIQTQAGFTRLNWTTQSEINNAYWNVYRAATDEFCAAFSVNNEPIDGQGTSVEETSYTFVDESDLQNQTYWYWLESVSLSGSASLYEPISITMEEIPNNPTPPANIVYGVTNYPNPFNPETDIRFALKEAVSNAELSIYNLKGQKIRTLYQGSIESDRYYTVTWDGKDNIGKQVASGIYFYKLETVHKSYLKKMTLIK